MYEQLRDAGISTTVVRQSELQATSLSKIGDRGARYVGFRTLSDMCVKLRTLIEDTHGPAYIHAYYGALDMLAHTYGVASPQHDAEVCLLDYAFGEVLLRGLRSPKTLLLLFADHGQKDSAEYRYRSSFRYSRG